MTMDIATLGINIDARQIKEGEKALDSFQQTGDRAEQTTDALSKANDRLARALKAVVAALAVQEIIKYADAWANVTGRLKLVSDSTSQLTKTTAELYAMAQRTRVSLEGTVDLYGRIKRTTADLNVTDSQRLKVTEAINKAMIISGASTQSAAAALLQLGQAFAANRLGGQELNSVLEQAPRLAEAIAAGMGRTVGDLKTLGAAGKLTADQVFGAILNQAGNLDEEFKRMPTTIGQAMTVLENSLMRTIGVFDQTNHLSSDFAHILVSVADNIGLLVAAVAGLTTASSLRWFINVTQALYDKAAASMAATAATQAQAAAEVERTAAVVAATEADIASATATRATVVALQQVAAAELKAANATIATARTTIAAAEAAGAQSFALRTLAVATLELEAAEAKRSAILAEMAVLGQKMAATNATLAASTEALAVAETAAAGATTAAAAAGSVLTRALGLMGGPIGIITTLLGIGVTAWLAWGNKAAEAETKAEQTLAQKTEEIVASLDKQIDKLKERNRLMNIAPDVAKGDSPAQQQQAAILTEINRVSKDTSLNDAARTEILRTLGAQYGVLTERLKSYNEQQAALNKSLNGDKLKQWLANNTQYLSKSEQLAQALADAHKELGDAFTPDIQKRIEKAFAEQDKDAKKMEEEYKNLIKTISEKTAVQKGELDAHQELTEGQKYALGVLDQLRTGTLKLSEAQATQLGASLESYLAAEKLAKEHEQSIKDHQTIIDQTYKEISAANDQVDALQEQIDTYGMGAAAIARYNRVKLETQLIDAKARGDSEEVAKLQALIEANKKVEDLANKKDDLDRLFNVDKVESFGNALRDVFGSAGDALGTLVSALQDFQQTQEQYEKDSAKVKLKYTGDETRTKIELAKLDKKNARDQLNYYAQIAGASKNFFKEHTAAYKVMETIERAARALELAETLSNMAAKLFATKAVTAAQVEGNAEAATSAAAASATEVAGATAAAQANAVAAVANQGNGDPYSAFFRIAAMAAIMAGLGLAVGGGGGSGAGVNVSKQRQDAQGTGSVLGDENAKSDSITKSMEILKNNSNIALQQSAAMLSSLRSIDAGISGMANLVARTSGLRGTPQDEQAAGVGSSKGFLGFNSSSTTLLDQGIQSFGQTIGNIIANGFAGSKYTETQTSKSSFFGLKHSNSTNTTTAPLDAELADQFQLTIKSIAEGVKTAASAFGIAGGDVISKINGFTVSLGQISLKGLSGDDIEKQLESVFSKVSDDLAKQIIPGLDDFQKVGEGYFETAVRVANGVEEANYQLEQFGITAVKFGDIINKQGDVAAEIVRQSILSKEGTGQFYNVHTDAVTATKTVYPQIAVGLGQLTQAEQAAYAAAHNLGTTYTEVLVPASDKTVEKLTGIGTIMQNLNGSAEDLANTYAELLKIQDSFKEAGLDTNAITASLITGAKDISGLQSSLDSYFGKFFTTEEQLAAKTDIMSAKFKALGLTMPTTLEGFRDLVNALPKVTDEDQKLLGKVLSLADGFADLHDALPDPKQVAQDNLDALTKTADAAFDMLSNSIGNEKKKLDSALTATMAGLDAQIKTTTDSVNTLKKLSDSLHSTLNKMQAPDSAAVTRAMAQAQIFGAVAIAKAGGPLPDADSISNALSVVSQDASALFANEADYRRDFYTTANAVNDLAGMTDNQLSDAQKMLDMLNSQKDAAQAQHDAQIAVLDAQLDQAKAQNDALHGIDDSILSLADATAQFAAATGAAAAAKKAIDTANAASSATGGASAGFKNDGSYIIDNHNGSATYYTGTGGSHTVTDPNAYSMLAQTYPNAAHYANGGDHAGGWRWVGERGKELEYTAPSHVVSNSDARDMLDMRNTVAAIKDMHRDMIRMNMQIIKHSSDTANNTDKQVRLTVSSES
jgi:tape measure domain-containing protein